MRKRHNAFPDKLDIFNTIWNVSCWIKEKARAQAYFPECHQIKI